VLRTSRGSFFGSAAEPRADARGPPAHRDALAPAERVGARDIAPPPTARVLSCEFRRGAGYLGARGGEAVAAHGRSTGVRQPLNRPARCVRRPVHRRGRSSRRGVDGWAREAERDPSARLREHPQLSRRIGSWRRAGAVQELGDGSGIGDDLEDLHPPAALRADRDPLNIDHVEATSSDLRGSALSTKSRAPVQPQRSGLTGGVAKISRPLARSCTCTPTGVQVARYAPSPLI